MPLSLLLCAFLLSSAICESSTVASVFQRSKFQASGERQVA